MRKFYVTYRECISLGGYGEYYKPDSIIITLNEGEKAHPSTFEEKLKGKPLGSNHKEIMSWCLIEE